MKQNIFKKLMLIAVLLTSNAVWAYDFESGGIYYNILSETDKTVEVTYKDYNEGFYGTYSGNVIIPSSVTYNETRYNVLSIGDNTFSYCQDLTNIFIPEGITSIGQDAFFYCENLPQTLELPSSINSIENFALYYTNIRRIKIASNTPPIISNNSLPEKTSLVLVPKGAANAYKVDDVWSNYTIIAEGSFDVEVTNDTGGELEKSILIQTATDIHNITSLKVKGKLNSSDLELIKNNMTSLLHLDITETDLKKISESAFKDNVTLLSVKLPQKILSINAYAFQNCINLTDVTIPEGLTLIDSYAFSGCDCLSTIEFPSTITHIGSYAFYHNGFNNNTKIKRTIKCNAKNPPLINKTTFNYNDIKLTVPFECVHAYKAEENWNTSTTNYIYYITYQGKEVDGVYYSPISETEVEVTFKNKNYNSYNSDVVIPTEITVDNIKYNVTSIGDHAFSYCDKLTNVTIPNTITSIGNYAFYKCSGLTSVTIGNSVTSIGENAFSDCSGLKSVTIGNSVTSIGNQAFSGCTDLTSVTIPNSVTSIGHHAFYKCSGLTYLELPSTISNIGGYAFAGGYNNSTNNYDYITRTIKCNAKTPPTLDYGVFNNNYLTLEVPFESILNYKAIEAWTTVDNGSITYKPKEVEGIYYLPTSDTEVEVTFKDKNYNSYAGDVVIPAEIKVGDKTFKVTSIGDNAFYSCDSLTNVTIPEGVTSIGDYVFSYCKKLTNVKIPNTVTRIGNYAFLCCRGLTSMTISEGITFIGEHTFEYCSSLTSITIPNGITFIGNGTFRYCSSLKSVIIPNSVTNIGNNAFSDSGLISVTIPNSVTLIEEDAFFNCTDLTSVVLSNNITNIGKGAFSWCSLSNIECKATIPPVCGINVFYNSTTALLKVPFESVLAYKSADVWKNFIYYAGSEVDGIYYLPTSKTEVAVTYKDKNYNSYTSDVAIPDTIMVDSIKYNVTSIGERAFYNCNKLNGKVSLPSSITSIGEYAFSGTKYSICEISATTPPTISSSSLSAETSLVLVPTGTPNAYKAADVWKNYTIIAEGSCDIVVTNAKGGELARSILTQTRKNLQNITGLKVKGTLNSIDLELINTNMSSLLHLDITETDVTEIPAEAFKNVVTLMSIKLPSTLQTIGDYAFSGCKVLSGELILPEKLTKIGNYAFQNCSGLSGTLKIPANVTYINSYAFSGCYNIKNIDMTGATKLYEIGNNAFRGCTTIESVDMAGASRLINLGTYIFSGCTGLKSVDMTGAKSLTSLSSYIFNGCNSLETVLFPETLETIGSYSFYNCAKLDNLKLPTALKSINSSAFNYCTGLKSIDMTEAKSMTSLTSYLFSNLYSLETVLFPETLETIGNNSFYNCTKLNNIKLPAALKSIDSSAFYGCTGMTTIDFSACTSLSTIYSSAFYGCVGLTMLDLLACESLITIKDSAFSGCSALATINFPISLVSIGSNAFANCTNLLQLSVPCTIPPVIENHAEPFAGVDNIACILSIPSENFFDYYSANYWGGFVDVEGKSEVQNGVNDATDEEDGEGEGDSAGEGDETGKHKKHKGCKVRFKKHHKGGHSPRLMALKGVNTLAETEDVSNTSDLGFTGDGQSLFVGFGESVTYYLTPEEGKEIESVYFNDEDVTSQLVNNTLTVTVTSDMTMTSFVVNMKNASPKLAGDINGDGEVNVTDVVKLYSYILGNSTDINESVVDLNGDGEVNVSDIVKLYSIILSSN